MASGIPYKAPFLDETSFNCPHCSAFANQEWYDAHYVNKGTRKIDDLKVSFCSHCYNYSAWHSWTMIFPEKTVVIQPNKDLPEDISNDYKEAASILQKSPRGAAALLRLCIQKLCKELGEKGKDINTDIGELVKKGLPERVQQALDIVRVTGNEAVHPGTLDLKDNHETAEKLFKLVNFIAEKMITEPREVEELYGSLPQSKIEGINARDAIQ